MPTARPLLLAGLLLATASPLAAQRPLLVESTVLANASRQELDSMVAIVSVAAESARGRRKTELQSQAARLRARLQRGDFEPGSRIAIRVTGERPGSDTLTVAGDYSVRLPGIPPISVRGVLRPEISAHLSKEFARYVRNVAVEAVPLVRVGVFGSVARPGFYLLPAEAPFSDALLGAGGAAGDADPGNIVVSRAGLVVHDRLVTTAAIRQSLSFAALDIAGGDVVTVGRAAPPTDRSFWLSLVGLSVGILTALAFVVGT
jgi:hypothetical protein